MKTTTRRYFVAAPSASCTTVAVARMPGSTSNSGAKRRAPRSCGGGGDGKGFLRELRELISAVVAQIAVTLGISARSRPIYELNDEQKKRLHALAMRSLVKYDGSKIEHTDALRALWSLAFGRDEEFPSDGKSERWKEMGWQGTSPETDFRGAGFMALENLVWFGENRPDTFRAIKDKAHGRRSEFEYPFAVAGVNLTFSLVELCEIQKEAPTTAAGMFFAQLLEKEEDAFEILYAFLFEALDREWLAFPGATYMDFPKIFSSTKEKFMSALHDARTLEEVGRCLNENGRRHATKS